MFNFSNRASYAECLYAECRYAECHYMLNDVAPDKLLWLLRACFNALCRLPRQLILVQLCSVYNFGLRSGYLSCRSLYSRGPGLEAL